MADMNKAELQARVTELETMLNNLSIREEETDRALTSTAEERDALKQSNDALTSGLNDEQAAHAATREACERLTEELRQREEAEENDSQAEAAQSDVMAQVSGFLMDIPDDSNLKKAVFAFLDSLVENYKDGPGAPGRNAYAILSALADNNDTAYKSMTVMARAQATMAANSLKGAFK